MASKSNNDRCWIVLIQKSPRGPFSKSEVLELIRRGSVSRNDVCYKIPEKQGDPSGWKLLWQYPEFDRRSQENQSESRDTNAPERRRPVESPITQDEKTTKEAAAQLPPEMVSIQPEELVIRSKQTIADQELNDTEFPASDSNVPNLFANPWFRPGRVAAVGTCLVVLVTAALLFTRVGPPDRIKPAITHDTSSVPRKGASTEGASPLSNVRRRDRFRENRANNRPIERPRGDRGEVSETYYEDLREEEEEWEEELEERKPKKKKKKKKKKRRRTEDSADDDEEPVDEEEEEDEEGDEEEGEEGEFEDDEEEEPAEDEEDEEFEEEE